MMSVSQGTTPPQRYRAVPRTLVFLLHGQQVLLLRGAPGKRLWAGRLNGIGGHVEAGEDILSGARREVWEEAGLSVSALDLGAVIHIAGQSGRAGVILFVFTSQVASTLTRPSAEGDLAWYPLDDLPTEELVDDLPILLPRLLRGMQDGRLVYGLYEADDSGRLSYHFDA